MPPASTNSDQMTKRSPTPGRFFFDIDEPVYSELIRFAASRRMTFSVVLRDGVQLSPSTEKSLASCVTDTVRTSEWSGTRLAESTATLYSGLVTSESLDWLPQPGSLFSWKPPEFPEDLAFYDAGRVVLYGTSHEGSGWVDPAAWPSSFSAWLSATIEDQSRVNPHGDPVFIGRNSSPPLADL